MARLDAAGLRDFAAEIWSKFIDKMTTLLSNKAEASDVSALQAEATAKWETLNRVENQSNATAATVTAVQSDVNNLNSLIGVQYPAGIVPITSNTTLGSAHAGKFILAGSSSAITLTLPSSGMTLPDELEIYNSGTANVTITGALRLGSAASSAKSIVLSEGNGVTVKMIAASGAGMWLVIGTFKEA